MNRGKLAVVSMILLAVLLAAFGLWWNITSGRRTLEFWGKDAAARIIDDTARVELLWLRPVTGDAAEDALTVGERTYAVTAAKDVTGARGLIHARHALVEDASFSWGSNDPRAAVDYSLAVRFHDDSGTTTVAFDLQGRQVTHVESGRQQRAAEKIVAGWQTFADRYAPPP